MTGIQAARIYDIPGNAHNGSWSAPLKCPSQPPMTPLNSPQLSGLISATCSSEPPPLPLNTLYRLRLLQSTCWVQEPLGPTVVYSPASQITSAHSPGQMQHEMSKRKVPATRFLPPTQASIGDHPPPLTILALPAPDTISIYQSGHHRNCPPYPSHSHPSTCSMLNRALPPGISTELPSLLDHCPLRPP